MARNVQLVSVPNVHFSVVRLDVPNAKWELTQRMRVYYSLILQLVLPCLALLVALCKIACRTRYFVLQLVMFVGGVANLTFPYMTEYSHLVGFSILIGCSDSFISLMSVIPQELVGEKEAVNAFGVLSFTSAIIGAIGWPAGVS